MLGLTIGTVIKMVWYQQKDRHTDQWKRTENPEIDPNQCAQLLPDKGAKAIQLEEPFQQMMLEQLEIHWQKNKAQSKPHTLYKN